MSSLTLRGVEAEDWRSLNDLHRWAWFPERSQRGWEWLHRFGQGYPGWVLEDERGICGYLGNIRQTYVQSGARMQGAAGYSLIVLPRAKGGSRELLDAFRGQPNIFAASILNGNARSTSIYDRAGFIPFPNAWANAKIVWPLAPMTILSERLARARFKNHRPTRELFSTQGGAPATSNTKQLVRLDPWTDAASIDLFFAGLGRSDTVIADRSAASLQGRFSDPDRTAPPILCGWTESGRLSAIALGQLGKMTECEAPILDIIDVAWTGADGGRAATALLGQLKTLGRQLGASRMRLSLVNSATAAVAGGVRGGLLRRRHVHAHTWFPTAGDIGRGWLPTPYDGDYGFCLRPPPVEQPSGRAESGERSERWLDSQEATAAAPALTGHPA